MDSTQSKFYFKIISEIENNPYTNHIFEEYRKLKLEKVKKASSCYREEIKTFKSYFLSVYHPNLTNQTDQEKIFEQDGLAKDMFTILHNNIKERSKKYYDELNLEKINFVFYLYFRYLHQDPESPNQPTKGFTPLFNLELLIQESNKKPYESKVKDEMEKMIQQEIQHLRILQENYYYQKKRVEQQTGNEYQFHYNNQEDEMERMNPQEIEYLRKLQENYYNQKKKVEQQQLDNEYQVNHHNQVHRYA
jgi:hypothetical protein